MTDWLFAPGHPQDALEIAHVAGDRGGRRAQVYVDLLVRLHAGHKLVEVRLHVGPFQGPVDAAKHTAELRLFFRQVNFEPLVG